MKIFFGFIIMVALTIIQFSCKEKQFLEPVDPPTANTTASSLGELHIEGRYLKNNSGEIVNLHGFAQTYSPFFNDGAWDNYDVQACLNHNKGLIDDIMAAGWKFNFLRLHMDPYWSSIPGCQGRYEGHECFDETRFEQYLDLVFIPMAEYAISKGLYVVMRPPGVCPEQIEVGDDYNDYLVKVWGIVSQHPNIKSNLDIMFELANEPIDILGPDGTYADNGQGHFDNLKIYFQTVVDTIRQNSDNIIWVPGLGYQSSYSGFANNPIQGDNIGYAVHVYPGWFNSGEGYQPFQNGWDQQVKPVADFAPIIVTEMDWAPEHYNASWGKGITGTAGGAGFGANFKYITDNSGNVSWLIFTENKYLADFEDIPGTPGAYTFLNDPEACPWPVYHWLQEYDNPTQPTSALTNLVIEGIDNGATMLTGTNKYILVRAIYADGHTELVTAQAVYSSSDPSSIQIDNGNILAIKDGAASLSISYTDVNGNSENANITIAANTFPLTNELFNPSIWAEGTFSEATKTLITGQYGFGGWYYGNGIDLSDYKWIVVELGNDNQSDVSFRLFDENSYWSPAAEYNFGNSRQVVVDLENMYKQQDGTPVQLDPSHIFYAGFWSLGGQPIIIDQIYLTNTNP